ncbi:MAG: HAMP domain-containing histidine kinase, partial [Proteobacteria bacterium]|nr:HAMP domain-containing histidine kinase [Pseudomonadota bacterium]
QVILGAVLLETWATWTLVAVTSACFVFLTLLNRELVMPHRHGANFLNLHIQGMFICFVLAAMLLVFFITRINRNLVARDAGLAALRQQSAEEELVVRMGLLASGAAHELGTPLTTVSVILNDWQRMPELQADAEIADDIEEMQAQILRCKEIVSKVLASSGEARGENAGPTTVVRFFDAMVEEWQVNRMPADVRYSNEFAPDHAIASDVALKQSLVNVLDNALEASPRWVGISVRRTGDDIVMTVEDRGPGIPAGILAVIGKPYQTTKTAPGSGLGLFLLANVVRKLGGSVVAGNRAEGGAKVSVRLPVAALSVEPVHVG